MGWSGLERNKLDYILTDLLPVEMSELFSFSQFYSFLLKKEQQKTIKNLIQTIKHNRAKNDSIMFKDGWSTKPLKSKRNGYNARDEYHSAIFRIKLVFVY